MAGIIGINRDNEQPRIQNALSTMAHRGPAGRSVRVSANTTFGCVWPTAQELYAIGHDKYQVVLDGEIYNWTDLAPGATCPLEALESAFQ